MAYYKQHVFFCTNQKSAGKQCCQNAAANEMREYAKAQIKALGLAGKGRVRINAAGCMDRCAQGPVLVIYPEAVWYRYSSKNDIDEIIIRHLQQGNIVQRLLLT